MSNQMSTPDRDIDLTGLTERLRVQNPGLTSIRAEAPKQPGAGVRVVVETTRAELQAIGGRLALNDPELEGLQIETNIRFLDHEPGKPMRVQMRRAGS